MKVFMSKRSGSGITNNKSSSLSVSAKPSYFRETEKAVQLRMNVSDVDLEQTISRNVFVSKSQLSENGVPGEWISNQKAQELYPHGRSQSQYDVTWSDAKGNVFTPQKTNSEKARANANQQKKAQQTTRYNSLLSGAKAKGVKVRKGMKVQTILKALRTAGINYSYDDYLSGKKV